MIYFLTGVISCNIHVCLTWRISVDKLTLVCKIDNRHLSVFIDDPIGSTRADCFPGRDDYLCDSYYQNESISQNSKTNEIIYTVHRRINQKINGNWSCRHGTSHDEATVEVTVLGNGK